VPDDIIDDAVVRVSPDLTGFRKKLQAEVMKASAGVEAKVRLVADATGWATSVDDAIKAHLTRYGHRFAKVRLAADATGWATSVKEELAKHPQATAKVRLVADSSSLRKTATDAAKAGGGGAMSRVAAIKQEGDAEVAAEDAAFQRVMALRSKLRAAEDQAAYTDTEHAHGKVSALRQKLEAAEEEASFLGKERSFDRERNLRESYERAALAGHIAAQKREEARVRSDAEAMGRIELAAHEANDSLELKRARDKNETLARLHDAADAEQTARDVERQRKDSAFLSFQDKVNGELNKINEARASDEEGFNRDERERKARFNRDVIATDIARLTLEDKIEKQRQKAADESARADKRRAAERNSVFNTSKIPDGSGLIDFGGSGIRPQNLLIAAAVALSPALLAVASSAAQASTAIAAVGAASIGTALGVTALVVGFSRITDALTLRQQVRKEDQRAAAASTENVIAERARAQAITVANRGIRDSILDVARAQRDIKTADSDAAEARKAVTQAYVDAAQRVKDLRSELESLALQEQQDSLDVAGAREKLDAVNRNFWSTDIEKRQAALDLKKALDRQGNTKDDEAKKKKELNQLDRDGLGKSKEVLAAKKAQVAADRAAADARRALTAAQTREADATQALATAKLRDAQATSSTSSASQDLKAQIAAMSPAARAMYYWFERNQGMLDKLRSKMEKAVLPGFLTFLEAVTNTGKKKAKGKSTLDLLADSAATLGKIIGDTAGRIGKLTTSKWFRGDFAKISKENEKSFKLLGKAAEILLKPISAVVAAASPLFTKFSAWILDMSTKFADFIDKHVKDGSLVKWFKDAWTELSKWASIAKNLLTFLGAIFNASLPTGKDLVSRIGDLTKSLADWSTSTKGKKELKDLFDWIKNLPYKRIAQTVGSVVTLLGALKLFTLARDHPLYLILGRLAVKYPKETADLLNGVADAVIKVIKWADAHPVAAGAVLGILTAVKNAKSVSIGLKVLGLGETILGKLFQTISTMTVNAAVVNLVGGGAAGLGLGVEAGGAAAAGATGWAAFRSGFLKAAGSLLRVAGGLFLVDIGLRWTTDAGLWTWAKRTFAFMNPALVKWFNDTDWSGLWDGVKSSWKGFDAWFTTDFRDFWSHRLPDTINLGDGKGWSGLWDGIKSAWNSFDLWFTTDFRDFWGARLPDSINLGDDKGWSGLGTDMLNGIKNGLQSATDLLPQWVPGWALTFFSPFLDALGIHSPSTVTAEWGSDLIQGLWNGFTTKWTGLLATATAWVGTNIGDPLGKKFAEVGTGVTNAFVKAFDSLTTKLAPPVTKAFAWLQTNMVDKVNLVLNSMGVVPIAGFGAAAGKGIADIGKIVGTKPSTALADGGPVPGFSPHSRADNIHARLTAGEYVQPVNAVKKYGVPFMESIRDGTYDDGAFADGGLVQAFQKSQGTNVITGIMGAAIKQAGNSVKDIAKTIAANALGSVYGGHAVGSAEVAAIAEATARGMGATDKQLLALIETGIVESGMRNLKVAVDHDSLGFLQQRPSQGWGTPAQVTDVAYATRSFISRAKRNDKKNQSAGQLAQSVQRSAFPGRYDLQEANAFAILNAVAPGIGGGGQMPSAGGSFGAWPSSAASVHGHDSGIWRKIIALVSPTGLDNHKYGTLYQNRRTDNGGWSWHASGRAVDFGGYNQDKLAQFFEARRPSVLELIHSTKNANYGIQRGQVHDMGHEFGLHKNHLHVAMAGGGLVPRAYDTGGALAPGLTLAYNGTGKNETVRTAEQEKALTGGSMRLDPRDLALMAQHIALATSGTTITMDGRKVAETVASYNYLHGGV
jgi:hypothetical protein